MSGLTDAERESLNSVLIYLWSTTGRPGSNSRQSQIDYGKRKAAAVVEQIVAAHVTEALTNAADLMSNFLHDPECESCDDVRDCIEIVRAAIP